MKRTQRSAGPAHPPDWEVSTDFVVNGRHLTPGTEASIRGERGRFRFLRAVRTGAGAEWLDFVGGPTGHAQWRSFRPDRVRTVHRLVKTRGNAA